MSGIAVQSNPTSAVFLDTYAWVYFKQGNYLLAMMYIEQAYNNEFYGPRRDGTLR